MTRAELAAVLVGDGFNPEPVAIGFLLMHAELEQVICSGPMAGRKHTYALMDDRVPEAPALELQDAVVRLIRQYLRGRGPASVADMAWWSSLTRSTLQAGIEVLAGELRLVVPGAMLETSPGRFTNTVVLNGLVRGGWARRFRGRQVDVTVTLAHDLSPAEQEALGRAVDRYGSFLARDANLMEC